MSSIGSIDTSVASIMTTQSRPAGQRPSGPPPGFDDALESAAEQAGIDPSEFSDLRTQIEEAITSAKESADEPGAIREAVNAVLEENGIDVSDFQSKLESMRNQGGRPPGPPPGEQSGADSAAESGDLSILSLLQNLPAGSLINTDA